MRWRFTLGMGLVLAAALYVGAVHVTPANHDGPAPVTPYYLLWAAICMVGLAVAGAALVLALETRPRQRAFVARPLVGVACVLALLALGELCLHLADQPPPGRLSAQDRAFELFFAGALAVGAAAGGALVAINRRALRARG